MSTRPHTSLFKDPALGTTFNEQGYIVLPFLNPDEIEQAKRLYDELHAADLDKHAAASTYAQGLFASTFITDPAYRQRVSDEIGAIFKRGMDQAFQDYKLLSGGYIIKFPHPESEVPPHQDSSFVDESRFTPLTIWCPLEDITPSTGALSVLPGSHRWPGSWRALTIPSPYRPYLDLLKERMDPIYIPAGTAIIFTHTTFHASQPNHTDAPRVIASSLIAPREAEIEIAYRDPENPDTIEIYTQDDDFFIHHTQFTQDVMGRPKIGRRTRTVPFSETHLSESDIDELLASVSG